MLGVLALLAVGSPAESGTLVGSSGATSPEARSATPLPALRPAPVSLQQDAGRGDIAGFVAEEGTLQPVREAVIRLTGTDRSTTSDPTGRFRIGELPAGTYELHVSALGYREARFGPVSVEPDGSVRVEVLLESRPLALGRLVVTATKDARSSRELAALTTVVDREAIDARGDRELVDALENTAGVIHSAQAGSFESVELRGMPRGGNEFESTLLLIDGVPQTDSRNSARVINLPIDNAASVEVVRGPNSALYGRTAIGGAVHVRTARPTARTRVRADLQTGEFGQLRGAASASGPLEQWGGYYLSWSSHGSRGFYDRDPHYEVDETSVFGKFVVAPDERSEAMVSANHVTSQNALPTNVPVVDGRILSDVDGRFGFYDNLNLEDAGYHQEELRLTAHYRRTLGSGLSFTNVFGYRDIQYRFEETGDIIGAPFDLEAGTLTMYPFSLRTDEEIVYEEARLRFRPSGWGADQELLAGASFESNTGFRRGDLIYTDSETFGMPLSFVDPAPPPRSDWQYFEFGGDDYRLASLGVYAQYEVSPLPRLGLTAAGRFDLLDLENVETLQENRPETEATYEAFSPKLTAVVRILEGTEVTGLGALGLDAYANYSEAFKPPRTPSGLNPPDAEARLDPEDITSFEIGLKGELPDGRASFQAAYFQMVRDGIVVSTREGPFFRDSNAGRQDFEGVEMEGGLRALPGLDLRTHLTFYRNRFGDFVIQREGGDFVLSGNRLPLVPDRVWGAEATYRRDGWGITVGWKRVGDRYVDRGNTLPVDPYGLMNTSVFWSTGPFRLTISGRNLLDERYVTYGDISNAESVSPGAPRQLLVGLRFVHD